MAATLQIIGGRLCDTTGQPLLIRGIENYYDSPPTLAALTAQANAGANAVRILWHHEAGRLPWSAVDTALGYCAQLGLVVYWSIGGYPLGSGFTRDEDYWADQNVKALVEKYKAWIVIDAMQEYTGSAWVADTIARVQSLRAQGYTVPFTAIGPMYGRDLNSILAGGAAIEAGDPLHATIMGWQAYWYEEGHADWSGGWTYQGWQGRTLAQGFQAASAATFPIQAGIELYTDGPAYMDWSAAMAAADQYGIGWLWWVWAGGAEANYLTDGGQNGTALNALGVSVRDNAHGLHAGVKATTPRAGPTIGAVTYPTPTTWEVVVSDLEAGSLVFNVTSDGELASVVVQGAVDLVGAVGGAAVAGGVLTAKVRLVGSVAAAPAQAAGGLTTQIGFVGQPAASALIAGALTTGIRLAGAVSSASTVAAGLVASAPWIARGLRAGLSWLAGPWALIDRGAGLVASLITGRATVAAGLSTDIRLAGGAQAQASTSAAMQTAVRLAGSVAAPAAQFAADLTTTQAVGVFEAAAAGSAELAASLTTEVLVSGAAQAQARVRGSLFEPMATPAVCRLRAQHVRVGLEAEPVPVGIEARRVPLALRSAA